MWKTVIIDDDPNLLEGMRHSIPWGELNAEWIGEETDGRAGLELIMHVKPDIVICDVDMPIMNGLEMIEKLRSRNYSGKIIILSGYAEFEYARQALRLDVDDYLNKPVSIDTMKSVLHRVIQDLNAHREQLRTVFRVNNKNSQEAESASVSLRSVPFYHRFAQAIRNGHENQVLEMIDGHMDPLGESVFEQSEVMLFVSELLAIVSFTLFDLSLDLDRIDMPDKPAMDDNLQYTVPALKEWLGHVASAIMEHMNQDDNPRHRKIVEFIKEYTDQHYMENLTLGSMAEKVNVSKNYLGQIFKNVVNQSFNSYLTQVRMEKAKQMLMHENLYIYEVAERVGYNSISYFSTQFKKYTGKNPTELL